MFAVYAGGKANSADALKLLGQSFDKIAPNWQVVLVQEADCKLHQLDDACVAAMNPFPLTWKLIRHWPGQGCFAQLVIIKLTILEHVRWTSWEGRCVGLLLSTRPISKSEEFFACNHILIIGIHAKSGGDFCHELGDINRLFRFLDSLPGTGCGPAC